MCNACWALKGDVDQLDLNQLKLELAHWKDLLPTGFDPWALYERRGNVLHTVKYFNTWHVIAWQFYHAAVVLLAVHLALFLPPIMIITQNHYLERETLTPTRQHCAVTSSNEMGTQINGAALVAWCGQFLINKDEQTAVIEWLDNLVRRTKWPNKTCSDRLRRIWSGEQSRWTADPIRLTTRRQRT